MQDALQQWTNLDRDTMRLVIQFSDCIAGLISYESDRPFISSELFGRHLYAHFDSPFKFWMDDCAGERRGQYSSLVVVPPMDKNKIKSSLLYRNKNKIKSSFPKSIVRIYYFLCDRSDGGEWEILALIADECGSRNFYAWFTTNCSYSGHPLRFVPSSSEFSTLYVGYKLAHILQCAMSYEQRRRYKAFRRNCRCPVLTQN